MKKNVPAAIKNWALAAVATLLILDTNAQKNVATVPSEIANKINSIVKPLKEQADKLLNEDATGTYKAYQNDVSALNKMKNGAEKSKASNRIINQYAAFFKTIWSNLNVDEKAYQSKIRAVLPASMAERISFQQYLNFSITTSNGNPPPATTPPPTPLPENKCIDVCSIAAGEVTGTGTLIASGAGSYGNCYLRANAWATVAGGNDLYASLKNNITIPGTLPLDARKLRVKKSFELKQEATAFAVLGFSLAETRVMTYQGNEYLMVMAPVIFGANKIVTKSYSEEYVIEKADVSRSKINASANTFAYFIAANWCYSECSNIKWSICEEK
jgi:hypothetical protein